MGVADSCQKDRAFGAVASGQGNGDDFREAKPFEVVAGREPWFEAEVVGMAVRDGERSGVAGQEGIDRDTGNQRLDGLMRGFLKAAGTGETELRRGMEQHERGLLKAAALDDGLADLIALPVEVVEPAAGEGEADVRFELMASPLLTHLGALLQAELVFEGQHDHADGGDD